MRVGNFYLTACWQVKICELRYRGLKALVSWQWGFSMFLLNYPWYSFFLSLLIIILCLQSFCSKKLQNILLLPYLLVPLQRKGVRTSAFMRLTPWGDIMNRSAASPQGWVGSTQIRE